MCDTTSFLFCDALSFAVPNSKQLFLLKLCLKPPEKANWEKESPVFTEVLSVQKNRSGQYICMAAMASTSGLYHPLVCENEIVKLYSDINNTMDAGKDFDKNPVIVFIQNNATKVPKHIAKRVADKHKKPIQELFPGYFANMTKAQNRKHQPKPNPSVMEAKPKSKPSVEDVPVTEMCQVDHDDIGNYRDEETSYYFLADRKYCNAKCRNCKKYFPTPSNIQQNLETGSLSLPPKQTVWICQDYFRDRCCCGNIICASCKESLGSRKRKRTPTNA